MTGLTITRWGNASEHEKSLPAFVRDSKATEDFAGCHVISPEADIIRIEEIINAGACKVLIADSALLKPELVSEAVERFGGERIGIWLPVRHMRSSWSLDRQSNADFSFVSVSAPVARWMVLKNNGEATDVDALWWSQEMMDAGCTSILASVSEPEDDDLLACAEMSEIAADNFWLDAGSSDVEELRFWVKYGHARQIVVPENSDIDSVYINLNQRFQQESAVG